MLFCIIFAFGFEHFLLLFAKILLKRCEHGAKLSATFSLSFSMVLWFNCDAIVLRDTQLFLILYFFFLWPYGCYLRIMGKNDAEWLMEKFKVFLISKLRVIRILNTTYSISLLISLIYNNRSERKTICFVRSMKDYLQKVFCPLYRILAHYLHCFRAIQFVARNFGKTKIEKKNVSKIKSTTTHWWRSRQFFFCWFGRRRKMMITQCKTMRRYLTLIVSILWNH